MAVTFGGHKARVHPGVPFFVKSDAPSSCPFASPWADQCAQLGFPDSRCLEIGWKRPRRVLMVTLHMGPSSKPLITWFSWWFPLSHCQKGYPEGKWNRQLQRNTSTAQYKHNSNTASGTSNTIPTQYNTKTANGTSDTKRTWQMEQAAQCKHSNRNKQHNTNTAN